MADQIYENCKLYVGGYDLSGDMNQLAMNYEAEIKDKTTFGSAGAREKRAGLTNVTMEHQGLVDLAEGDVDEVLFGRIGAAVVPVTMCPTDGSDGERAFSVQALYATYAPGAQVGEMFAFTVRAEGHGQAVRGTIMLPAVAKTTTGVGTIQQLGAVSATQKLYATLHVVAASGAAPTLDVTVKSDDAVGFLSPTTRITFTQAAAVGAQWATPVSGAITDDYWRIDYTIGGAGPSFTFVVVVSIQ